MPTHAEVAAFRRAYGRLSAEQRRAFRRAIGHMVEDLKGGQGFRKGLRVKGIRGASGMYEMTWAPDGRAIFTYGSEIHSGEARIVWVAIATHSVLP